METRKPVNSFNQFRISLLDLVESLGYAHNTIRAYQRELNKIEKFMDAVNTPHYNHDVGARFITQYVNKTNARTASVRAAETVVRRLDDLLSGSIRFYRRTHTAPQCPNRFAERLDYYTQHLRLRGNRESTIAARKMYCVQFLCSIEKNGVSALSNLQPKHIHDAFLGSNSKGSFRQAVVPFLKYLFKEGILDKKLSECVPGVRHPQPMPSVYSEDEICRLLASVNKAKPSGKRDYAILVIASQLGFRASDISALSMDSIDFQTKTIYFNQQKTGAALRTVLLPDVEEALIAYINNGRPINDSGLIFLRRRAPHTPLTGKSIYAIVRQYFHSAEINTFGKKSGPRALRMSLATKLLEEDVPYAAIQKILGHDDPNSTKHYTRMDVAMLRRCALEVAPPSGLFAERLGISERSGV